MKKIRRILALIMMAVVLSQSVGYLHAEELPEEEDESAAAEEEDDESEIEEYIREVQKELSTVVSKETVMALVYLCDQYEVKEKADAESKTLFRVPTGTTVRIIGMGLDEDWNRWYQVSVTLNGAERTGYIEKEHLAYSNEKLREWEDTFFPQMALFSLQGPEDGYCGDVEAFPESYQNALYALKRIHPEWIFVRQNIVPDWNTVISKESVGALSLINISNSAYQNGLYGAGWYYASKAALEYYMDPRNFLDETRIFQFEQLTFNASYHTQNAVQNILSNTFMSGIMDGNMTYAGAFYQIGENLNVSPFHLACRVYQEQGQGTSPLISGTYPGYSGYYNYFNIGASGRETAEIVRSGLEMAKSNGWNTRYLSLRGGASIISEKYIKKRQDTLYLQKFNVGSEHTLYTHQYMQNIMAPSSETTKIKQAYSAAGSLDNAFVFKIPVYSNMPAKACPKPELAPTATTAPTATPRPTATAVPTPVATAKPTATPTPTATAKPTATSAPTATAKPTATPAPIPTATPAVISKPTSTPTAASTAEPTAKATAGSTTEPTATPKATAASTATATPLQLPNGEPIPTTTPTGKPTATPKGTGGSTVTPTATPKATSTPTATPTEAPTIAPTATPTEAPTTEPTAAPTVKPTATPLLQLPNGEPIPKVTPTVKPTAAPVSTVKPTATPKETAISTAKSTEAPTATPVQTKEPVKQSVETKEPTTQPAEEQNVQPQPAEEETAATPAPAAEADTQSTTEESKEQQEQQPEQQQTEQQQTEQQPVQPKPVVTAVTPAPQTESKKDAIVMDMEGTNRIYAQTLQQIKEQGREVILNMNDNATWKINGNDIGDGELTDINLEVTIGESRIPKGKLAALTENEIYVELSLAHSGEFGFTATLTVKLEEAQQGQYANLFYYNEETGEFEFMCASLISSTGEAAFNFSHASDYVIIISNDTKENLLAEKQEAFAQIRQKELEKAQQEVEIQPAEEPKKAVGMMAVILLGSIALVLGIFLIVKYVIKREE